jgi:hypothetical protein
VAPHRFLLDEPRGFLQILRPRERIRVALEIGADVKRDDVRALGGEIDCVGTTLATRRTRHHSDLVIELAH